MRTLTFTFIASLLFLAGGESPKTFPVGDGGRLFRSQDIDALLARPYTSDVPMACAGDAIWAAHVPGWAFPPSSTHWYLLTPFALGFDLELSVGGRAIYPGGGTMLPSHVRLTTDQPVRVNAAKWITQDDVLVTQVTLENTDSTPVTVQATATLPVEKVELQEQRHTWAFEHAGLTLNAVANLPGFTIEPRPDGDQNIYMVEGEAAKRAGGPRQDRKAAASGGEVLGANFGGQAGDHVTWDLEIPEGIENAAVTIRYARAFDGDTDIAVRAPGKSRMEQRPLPSTGGWGDAAGDFRMETFRFGALAPGPANIVLYVLSDNGNINIDAVYVHPVNTQPVVAGTLTTRAVRAIGLNPGARETITLAMSAAPHLNKAVSQLDRVTGLDDPLRDQIDAYARWNLENVPYFASVDPAVMKQYWHRATSVVRKNLFRIGEGRLSDWGIAEGRWRSSWYANMISYGAGHQIRETRWLRNPGYARGIIATWCANAKPNGVFPNYIRPTEIGTGQYTDWITSTVWDAHCVHPDLDALRGWSGALARNVDGWLETYDRDHDGLLLVDSHWWTGMEWQPSFFFFNGYDKEHQEQHLERVDLTAYVYGSAKNLSRIFTEIGDVEQASKYSAIAEKIRDAVRKNMWDESTRFFYSVEPVKNEKALVKEIVGVYPFYFSMFDATSAQPYLGAWESILDPEQFWTPWPVASATRQCAAYSQDETFNGKRVGGCMWNGPTWPHANSIVLSAMAATLREHKESPVTADHLFALFQSFTMAQFKNQELDFPWTGEYYNGETGQWRTGERDYNHSTYIDVLIADIIGLRPRSDEIIDVYPLISSQMAPFVLDGVRYHDHDISILWSPKASTETQPDGLKGFRVYVDGVLRHHDGERPTRITITP